MAYHAAMTIPIAIVSKMSEEDRQRIRARGDVELMDFSEDRDGLAERGSSAQVVYGNVREHEFPKMTDLKWVHATWSGIENLLYPAMKRSEVIITNTRGQVAGPMSEHALAGLLYLSRDLPAWVEASRAGRWRTESHGRLLAGSTVAVLGTGAIAEVLIPKLNALGATVWGVNSDGRSIDGCAETFTMPTIRDRLGDVDHIVVLLASTPTTYKAINHDFLTALKPGAGVVNLSRGAVIDESALLDLLDRDHLRGAVLDVTDPEPPPDDSPLFGHRRVLLTGHRSWQPGGDGRLSMDIFLHNLRVFLNGRTDEMRHVVNKTRGY